MQAAIEQFRLNIRRVRDLGSIYQILSAQTTQALDLSDVLRSELIMGVSALDLYVHELVRLGMLEVFNGARIPTDAFLRFQVTLDGTLKAVANPGNSEWLDQEIRTRHGHRSFQDPEDIANAIRLVSGSRLWNEVATHLSSTPEDIRTRLKLIVDRRNKIVHEADVDPSYAGAGLWSIEAERWMKR